MTDKVKAECMGGPLDGRVYEVTPSVRQMRFPRLIHGEGAQQRTDPLGQWVYDVVRRISDGRVELHWND